MTRTIQVLQPQTTEGKMGQNFIISLTIFVEAHLRIGKSKTNRVQSVLSTSSGQVQRLLLPFEMFKVPTFQISFTVSTSAAVTERHFVPIL